MLLIAEVKEIVPARCGFRAVIKHVPDRFFALDHQLYESMGKRFDRELSLWRASGSLHMLMIATFGLNDAGVPKIEELSLMPTNAQWIPVGDSFEFQLVDRLLRAGRRFTKTLCDKVSAEQTVTTAMLLDTETTPIPLCIARPGSAMGNCYEGTQRPWVWRVDQFAMPSLPLPAPRPASRPQKSIQRIRY